MAKVLVWDLPEPCWVTWRLLCLAWLCSGDERGDWEEGREASSAC